MNLHFFTIPAYFPEEAQQLLNDFCTRHRVLNIEKQFVELGVESFWSCVVTYVPGNAQSILTSVDKKRERIDYKEVLNETDFAVYVQLHNLRKSLAEQEGVPAYALFTNEQLATMITRKVTTESGLSEIQGVGKARLEKYGKVFLGVLASARASSATSTNETL